jgi:hypothetical protein
MTDSLAESTLGQGFSSSDERRRVSCGRIHRRLSRSIVLSATIDETHAPTSGAPSATRPSSSRSIGCGTRLLPLSRPYSLVRSEPSPKAQAWVAREHPLCLAEAPHPQEPEPVDDSRLRAPL